MIINYLAGEIKMKNILLVCTGNTCRSSMAERIFKAELEKEKKLIEEFSVASAGISAYEGEPASRNAVRVMRDLWNLDIDDHKAKLLKKEHVDEAFLILTMTKSHKHAILTLFPEAKNKIFTLKEFAYGTTMPTDAYGTGFNPDIRDPYGMPVEVYKKCAMEIKDAIDKVIEKLKNCADT